MNTSKRKAHRGKKLNSKSIKYGQFNKIVKYTNNHRCEPNGLGDYDFICPKLGKIKFVPILLRESVVGCCPCGEKVELLGK